MTRMDDIPGAERRTYERYPVQISVDYDDGESFLFSYIENISAMGIFIRSSSPLPVGTHLSLRFCPCEREALELDGEVVWVNAPKLGAAASTAGMGVTFTSLTADQREAVVDLVRTVAYLTRADSN